MTRDEATMLGEEIARAAQLISVPIRDDRECRAICVKLAIETKNVALSLHADGTVQESAAQVLAAARMYHDFITFQPVEADE